MALNAAYWINPYGQIWDMETSTHIAEIIKSPEKFGLTADSIKKKYEEHGEQIGVEGKAREEIIEYVLKQGFIRVRLYKNYWSVTIYSLDKRTKSALGAWAEIAKDNKIHGALADVKILELKTNKMHNMTVKDIYFELYEGNSLIPVSALSEFIIPRIPFKSYLLIS